MIETNKVKMKTRIQIINTIQTIGGLILCLYIPLVLLFIWVDSDLVLKLLATNSVLVYVIYLLERYFLTKEI